MSYPVSLYVKDIHNYSSYVATSYVSIHSLTYVFLLLCMVTKELY